MVIEATREHTFCTSCGISSDPRASECDCGARLNITPPDPRLGQLIFIDSRWSPKRGVITGVGPDTLEVILESGKSKTIPSSKLKLIKTEVDLSAVASLHYRYRTVQAHQAWIGSLPEALTSPAPKSLSPVARRLLTRSAVAAGDFDTAVEYATTESELAWLSMRFFAQQKDWAQAAEFALLLPPDRYPDHYSVLLQAASRRALNRSELRTHIAQLRAHQPHITVLHALVDDLRPPTLELRQTLEVLGAPEPGELDPVSRALAVLQGGREERFSVLDQLRIARIPDALEHLLAANAATLDFHPEDSPLPVRVSVSPGSVSEEELRESEHWAEIARRAFLRRDKAALAALPDSEAVLHYRALISLAAGDTSNIRDLREHPVARAVVESLDGQTLNSEALEDPTTWDVLSHLISETDLPQSDASARWHLLRAMDHLYEWRWQQSAAAAKTVLRMTQAEALRDEALNVLAYCLYQLDQPEPAIAAVESALGGGYSANLQTNIGIIAQDLAPNVAAEHLARLAQESTDPAVKLAAGRRAYAIWDPEQPAWDDTHEEGDLPHELKLVFRDLIMQPSEPEDHLFVARMLSNWDSDWFGDETNTAKAPNASLHEHRVFLARSQGAEPFVRALKAALSSPSGPAGWAERERDGLVEGLTGLIFESEGAVGPGMWAFEVVDQGLPMSDPQRIILASGAVMSVCRHLYEEKAAPSDKLLYMTRILRRDFNSKLDDEAKQELQALVDAACNAYAGAVAAARLVGYQEAQDAVATITQKLMFIPNGRIDKTELRKVTEPIVDFLGRTDMDLENAQKIATKPELIDHIKQLRIVAKSLRQTTRELAQ